MRIMSVPISSEAMKRLDLDENLKEDLVELNLCHEEYENLKKIGYFSELNNQLGIMIDDYEDEKIIYESLVLALDITNDFSIKYSDNEKLWRKIKKLISIALEKRTAVFLFF
jgi:hypothetical protein